MFLVSAKAPAIAGETCGEAALFAALEAGLLSCYNQLGGPLWPVRRASGRRARPWQLEPANQ